MRKLLAESRISAEMKIAIRDQLTGLFISKSGESPDWYDAIDFRGTGRALDYCDMHHLMDYEVVAKLGYHSDCELVVAQRRRCWKSTDETAK